MKEIWKKIDGFENYEVSNLGNVRRIGKERFLSIFSLSKGYCGVQLCKDGKSRAKKVHRLVAKAFIPNPENFPQVNHKDCDKKNNKADNLEWCTNKYNAKHAQSHDRILRGEQVWLSKCTDRSIKYIQDLINAGFTIRQISTVYMVDFGTIQKIIKGKLYKHLGLMFHYNNKQEKRFHHKIIDASLYRNLNSSLRDNTELNTLIEQGYISVQCNA